MVTLKGFGRRAALRRRAPAVGDRVVASWNAAMTPGCLLEVQRFSQPGGGGQRAVRVRRSACAGSVRSRRTDNGVAEEQRPAPRTSRVLGRVDSSSGFPRSVSRPGETTTCLSIRSTSTQADSSGKQLRHWDMSRVWRHPIFVKTCCLPNAPDSRCIRANVRAILSALKGFLPQEIDPQIVRRRPR